MGTTPSLSFKRTTLVTAVVVGSVVGSVVVVGSGCPDRNRQAALLRLQVVVDEQRAADALCESRLKTDASPATVAFECRERRRLQLERYGGLVTMVPSPGADEPIPPFPAMTPGVLEAPDDDDGKRLCTTHHCLSCHSVDGSALAGSSLKGLYGATVTHSDGSTAVVDDAYLVEAIWYPDRRVTKGYVAVMPSYVGTLNAATVDVIIAYIKTLASPPASR